jgi:hypothetical protein
MVIVVDTAKRFPPQPLNPPSMSLGLDGKSLFSPGQARQVEQRRHRMPCPFIACGGWWTANRIGNPITSE